MVGDDRVAHVRDPQDTGQAFCERADQVHGGRRGGGEQHVDALSTDESCCGCQSGRQPSHVFVRQQEPPWRQPQPAQHAVDSSPPEQLLRRQPTTGTEEGRTMHVRACQLGRGLVLVDPLRIARREHVRFDPELGQKLREFQRPLDTATSGWRKIEGANEDLHLPKRLPTPRLRQRCAQCKGATKERARRGISRSRRTRRPGCKRSSTPPHAPSESVTRLTRDRPLGSPPVERRASWCRS